MLMESSPLYRSRKRTNLIGLTLSMIAMSLGLVALLWILFVLFSNGLAALELTLFTNDTPAPGSEGGGLRNAIVGSLMIVGLAVAVSTPIGILAGIYLTEYGDQSKTAELTRFVTDIMLSAPSIVIGLFVYAIVVATLGRFSGYAGSMALALIAVPVVMRTTENMLRLVPGSLREAAFALGAGCAFAFSALALGALSALAFFTFSAFALGAFSAFAFSTLTLGAFSAFAF
jgi:phosphate transport system permease protein